MIAMPALKAPTQDAPVPEAVSFAYTQAESADAAAQSLASQLIHSPLSGVMFFCSAEYDLASLGHAMEAHFDGIRICGCTTAGEITGKGYARNGIVAMGFSSDAFAFEYAVINDLDAFDLKTAQRLTDQLLTGCTSAQVAPIKGHTFVMTLLDGLSASEEQVLATLNAALAGIPHFGGSAGDDNLLASTHVFGNRCFHTAAAVVVMINTSLDFEVFSTHHLRPREDKLVVTAVNREQRRVLELNAEPAAEAYAALVGLPVSALDAEVFARHPLAVKRHEHTYVRAIQSVNTDGSLDFYCAVENGIVLTAMYGTPILDDLRHWLESIASRLGPPAMVIGCDCFLRRLEIHHDAQDKAAQALMKRFRVVGFSTYGEHCDGMHLNQTFSGVYLGRPRHGQ